jgi:amino acid transporter
MTRLIGYPTLVVGIILLAAGSGWFAGAPTVGLVLVIASAVIIVVRWVIIGMVLWAASSSSTASYHRVPPRPRVARR